MPPPVEMGTRKGSANTASGATSHGRRAMTAAAATSAATTTTAPDHGLQRVAMDDVQLR